MAARHQVPLNRIGEPLTVLPGRRLAAQGRIDNVVVMLDGLCAFAQLDDPALMIYWGAYLGTEDELLIAGPLQVVRAQILEVRERARARKGGSWTPICCAESCEVGGLYRPICG